jgi:GNAT superfamily N-acetyltransferase
VEAKKKEEEAKKHLEDLQKARAAREAKEAEEKEAESKKRFKVFLENLQGLEITPRTTRSSACYLLGDMKAYCQFDDSNKKLIEACNRLEKKFSILDEYHRASLDDTNWVYKHWYFTVKQELFPKEFSWLSLDEAWRTWKLDVSHEGLKGQLFSKVKEAESYSWSSDDWTQAESQGKAIGTALLKAVIDYCNKDGNNKQLVVTGKMVQALFEQDIAHTGHPYFGPLQDSIFFVKKLFFDDQIDAIAVRKAEKEWKTLKPETE